MFDINGKVAIVTGGANGIGKATVEAILAKGGLPVIADWDENLGKKPHKNLTFLSSKLTFPAKNRLKTLLKKP